MTWSEILWHDNHRGLFEWWWLGVDTWNYICTNLPTAFWRPVVCRPLWRAIYEELCINDPLTTSAPLSPGTHRPLLWKSQCFWKWILKQDGWRKGFLLEQMIFFCRKRIRWSNFRLQTFWYIHEFVFKTRNNFEIMGAWSEITCMSEFVNFLSILSDLWGHNSMSALAFQWRWPWLKLQNIEVAFQISTAATSNMWRAKVIEASFYI